MAKSLYKSAFGAGITSGKYKASMYESSSLEQQRSLEGKQLEIESEKLNRQLTNITSALSLASTAAGRYTDIKDDISTLETKFGEMEQPDTIFKKLMQGAKIGLGVGEYQFGDTSIKARDFASEVKKIEAKNMLQEVEESMAIPEPVKRPTLNVASKGIGSYEEEDFNIEYNPDELNGYFNLLNEQDEINSLSDGYRKADKMLASGLKLPKSLGGTL
tara:strand:- start:305 stop:955 length:651 start_codon:yes stop_codon:yes gene_type:complete